MTDVAAWLRRLGLGRYEAAFRDNAVDASVLPELTAEDLKEIGVAAVGHRRKLLGAIAALRGSTTSAAHSAESASDVPSAEVAPGAGGAGADGHGADGHGAERRQLTVLFCDLAGSTALSARLDPEDLREVMAAYHEAVAGAVSAEGGYVAKYLGDGVLAYFGWPQAHEDDAERAVRAGLAACATVAGLRTSAGPLVARAGIATGPAVVGDLLGEGAARERGVVGETPNLAARLQGLAEPGAVTADAATRRLTGEMFEWVDLGEATLKGVPAPVRAWRALGESGIESRFEALRAGHAAPLIGRDEELEVLLRRWRRARVGDGQVVLLRGEAGIGKSRLAAALREKLQGEAHEELILYCSPRHMASALHPVAARLERAAGLAPGAAPEERLAKLEALLAPLDPPPEDVAAIADLLSVPTLGRWPALDASPQRRRERLLSALLRRAKTLAAQRPVLAVVEDAHWLDPTTRELLDLLVAEVPGTAVLLVVTHRPEFDGSAWIGLPYTRLLQLSRLARGEHAALVRRVAGGKELPREVEAAILSRTDGVPLFAEELTKTVLSSGLLRLDGDRYVLDGPFPRLAVPATLRASLAERLDRLASVKDVAQTASVIGREFAFEILAAVTGIPMPVLAGALDQLIGADLVRRTGVPPQAKYVFRHALIQDAAYSSLLRTRRRQLHARVADALRQTFPELAETEPEALAHHYTEAGLAEEALPFWEAAGRRALARSAQREGTAHLRHAAELVQQLPSGVETRRRELRILLALGQALFGVLGPVAETVGVFDRALDLARADEDEHTLCQAFYGVHTQLAVSGRLERVVALGSELGRIAEQRGSAVARICTGRILGTGLYLTGRLADAKLRLEDTLQTYRGTSAIPPRSTEYAHHPGLTSPATLSHVLWALGFPERAVASSREAIEGCRAHPEANSLAYALEWTILLRLLLRDHTGALAAAEEAIQLGEERGSGFWERNGAWGKGAALVLAGEGAAGLALLEPNLRGFVAEGGLQMAPQGFCHEAEAYLALDELGRCEVSLEQARDIIGRTGQTFYTPELRRLVGLLHQRRGRLGDAVSALGDGIATAQTQGARSWELRSSCDLARLLRDQGHTTQARDLLAPVYAAFTEGFAFPDLVEARALLEELGVAPANGTERRREQARTPQGPDRLREPAPGR